jgi:hypothetical protein
VVLAGAGATWPRSSPGGDLHQRRRGVGERGEWIGAWLQKGFGFDEPATKFFRSVGLRSTAGRKFFFRESLYQIDKNY